MANILSKKMAMFIPRKNFKLYEEADTEFTKELTEKEPDDEAEDMIVLEDISKIYQIGDNEVRALDHASLSIRKGEFVSIIGPSGSGKSTMMNIIGCLDTLDEGKYYLEGQL